MGVLLSDLIHNHPINRYNNCTLPTGSTIKEIDYQHFSIPKIYGNIEDVEKCCTSAYVYYRENRSFILYKRRGKNQYHIYFK